MTEESGSNVSPDGKANPAAPEQASVQPGFSPEMLKAIQDEVARQTQSVKDKRIQKLENQLSLVGDQVKQFAALVKSGVSEDDALDQIELQALLAERRTKRNAPPEEPESDTPTIDASMYGLDPNDAKVAEAVQKGDLMSLMQMMARANANVSVAAVPAASGGGSVVDEAEALVSELDQLMRNPTQNLKRIKEIKARLK